MVEATKQVDTHENSQDEETQTHSELPAACLSSVANYLTDSEISKLSKSSLYFN